MNHQLRALAERYSATVAARDGIAHEHLPGGGVRQPLDRASLGIAATKLAHELAAEVVATLKTEPPSPESRGPRACPSCDAPVTADGCPLCDVGLRR